MFIEIPDTQYGCALAIQETPLHYCDAPLNRSLQLKVRSMIGGKEKLMNNPWEPEWDYMQVHMYLTSCYFMQQ